MIKDSKYIEFVHKKLTGSIDTTENALLEEWLAASVDNRNAAAEIEEAWNHSKNYLNSYQPNVEGGLLKLKARIAEDHQSARIKPLPRRNGLLRIAAAVVLLVGLGAALNYFIDQGKEIQWVSQQTQENGIETYTLSDGSTITLNQSSKLDYPEKFDGNQRIVKLEGEAFFDIARDEKRPFLIQTEQAVVKVLGTSFNVRSYDSEDEIEVTVRSGKVQFEIEEVKEKMILQAADCYRYSKTEKTVKKEKDEEMNASSWQTKRLAFVKTPLETVLNQIEKYYNIKIRVQDQDLKNCRFTAKFDDTPLADVLEILKASFSLEVEASGKGRYLLTGGQCN